MGLLLVINVCDVGTGLVVGWKSQPEAVIFEWGSGMSKGEFGP